MNTTVEGYYLIVCFVVAFCGLLGFTLWLTESGGEQDDDVDPQDFGC